MSRELYQARSIKTVKMGRDGLVETDRATGEERRRGRLWHGARFRRKPGI